MRTGNSSGWTFCGNRTASFSVCSTRAVNGTCVPFPARDVDAPDLAFAPDDDRLAVRRPRVLRVEAVDRPRFLQVLVDVLEELTVAAGLEIAQVQLALQTDAPE